MCLKYSVVIPIFNSERTLHKCLDSLLTRERRDVEIILVNDGSVDSSEKIILEYREKHPMIRYFFQKNQGVSAARNKGLSAAEGEYISFVDSDDWVSSDYFEKMDAALEDRKWDWILFSSTFVKEEKCFERSMIPFSSSDRSAVLEKVSDLICRNRINAPWAKVYRRDIIRHNAVSFMEGSSVAEDRAFNIKYAACISSLKLLSDSIYMYNISGQSSLTRDPNKDYLRDMEMNDAGIRSFLEGMTIPEKDRNALLRAVNFGVYRTVYTEAKHLINGQVEYKDRIKVIHKMCRDVRSRHLSLPKGIKWFVLTFPVKMNMAILIDCIASAKH